MNIPNEQVIAYYHQLFQAEATRRAKSDLKARPIYHCKRDAIKAPLTIALAALTISRNYGEPDWRQHLTVYRVAASNPFWDCDDP